MSLDLSDTLVIGISATALFDMKESDSLYRSLNKHDQNTAIRKYREYMLEHEDITLDPGTGYPLVKAILDLNKYIEKKEYPPLVEVVVMSRNSPETGIRVLKSIRKHGLSINKSAFTAGESVTPYLEAFDVDLFLTTNPEDAQDITDRRLCPVVLVKPIPSDSFPVPDGQVRIAFDGDAVLFDEKSEVVYKEKGLAAFQMNEDAQQDVPLNEGPYASFLKKLSRLQEKLPIQREFSPIRIALVTARNYPAEMRAIKTFRAWKIYIDEAFFLGGVEKSKILKAFRPHIFFDDQDSHLESASKVVPSGKVLYESGSKMVKA